MLVVVPSLTRDSIMTLMVVPIQVDRTAWIRVANYVSREEGVWVEF